MNLDYLAAGGCHPPGRQAKWGLAILWTYGRENLNGNIKISNYFSNLTQKSDTFLIIVENYARK